MRFALVVAVIEHQCHRAVINVIYSMLKTFRAGHVHILTGNQNTQVIYGIAPELQPFGSALYRIFIVIAIIAELHGETILENNRRYGNVICLALLKVTVKGCISR